MLFDPTSDYCAGKSLAKKWTAARCELRCQTEVHYMFTSCLPDPQLAQKWTDKVTAWENDMDGLPSPHMTEVKHE